MLISRVKILIFIISFILVAGLVYYLHRPPAAPEAEQSQATMHLEVFFSNHSLDPAGTNDCTLVYPVTRIVPRQADVARAALLELLKGPTEDEKALGYSSPFSAATADILVSVRVAAGKAYVDFKDFRQLLPEVAQPCGSQQFRHQVEQTLKQFPGIGQVIYAIEKIPQTFYDFVGVGCDLRTTICDTAQFP